MTSHTKTVNARSAKKFTLREAAKYLGIDVATVRRLAENGDLIGLRSGKKRYWVFHESSLQAWLDHREIEWLSFKYRSRL